MSKILDLATTFQQTSQKELENTGEIVQNAIKQHEQNLIQQLQHAGNNLAENIQIEQAKLIKNTVRMYRLPTLIALPNHLRISIGLPEENQLFLTALSEILGL